MVPPAFDRGSSAGALGVSFRSTSQSQEEPTPRDPNPLGSSGETAAADGRRTLGPAGHGLLGRLVMNLVWPKMVSKLGAPKSCKEGYGCYGLLYPLTGQILL